ncbi:hypothetical protein T484DRAFT_1878790 [Baffinella frigidus]|nr:hypothetical protein T484DRAFT_1878790 [Cryptophyta sp. CCMP2293]
MATPGVGLLVSRPRFSFGNGNVPKAGEVSSVEFSLRLAEREYAGGDSVMVVLEGFGGAEGSVDVLVDGASSEGILLTNVSTNENATTLLIQVLTAGLLTADAELQLLIPASAKLTIPLIGVRRDSTGISLTVSTASSTTTMACDAAAIGAFARSPQLVFAPPKAGAKTRVTLSFALASVELFEYEGVVLALPYLLGPSPQTLQNITFTAFTPAPPNASDPAVVPCPGGAPGQWCTAELTPPPLSAFWADCAPALTVAVTRNASLPAGVFVSVSIPEAAGFAVPPGGVRYARETFTLRAADALVPLGATPVLDYSVVGSFLSSLRLAFVPVGVPRFADIVLSFTPEMHLNAGDSLSIHLGAGLAGVGLTCLPVVSVPAGPFVAAHWDPSSGIMTLPVVLDGVRAGNAASVVIPAHPAVAIALAGLAANLSGFAVSTNAVEGPVPVTSVAASGAYGSLAGSSRLSFSCVGAASSATVLDVAYNLPLAPGDVLAMALPGFAADDGSLVVSSVPSAAITSCSWSSAAGTLDCAVVQSVAAGTATRVTIPWFVPSHLNP